MKELKPRYTICSIVTLDGGLQKRANDVRAKGNTHEDIYRAGLDAIEKTLINSSF